MKILHSILTVLVLALAVSSATAQEALRKSLIFYAPFDGGFDAVLGADTSFYTADSLNRKSVKKGNLRAEVSIAKGAGRFGDALRFADNSEAVSMFQGVNAGYRTNDWNGTVSFWIKLDPDKDLKPGNADPIQSGDLDDLAIFDRALTADEIMSIVKSETGLMAAEPSRYDGKYCAGEGDTEFLRLIDESFAFLHPNPLVPNVAMLYRPDWDTFEEGANWGEWWIQNSYGFSYAATPFLPEPWFSTLQRSWDLFWNNQGDGKRACGWEGPMSSLVAPDGCLGDCATPRTIAPKQGDGDPKTRDWFYEATAAGVVMQAEILLAQRDRQAMDRYLPKMERACNFIETARDPKNNLFLVGPACDLLAPSYGGVKQPDGSFGKGHLAGLSITYLAALDRMVELFRLTGDKNKLAEYERRQKITRGSLPLLLTPAGYFVKSLEPDGTKHGVLGQKAFGYLEGVANADAMGLRVVDDATAASIYRQIADYPAIRPFDFLLNNAPGLDDTYWLWGQTAGGEDPKNPEVGIYGARVFGCWVNGGAWGTVEGRALLGYYRLGKFDDVRRSAVRAMKWAKDFRMDAPWSQCGENTYNLWSDKGGTGHETSGLAIMVDNFAIPAATLRGLFDYEYRADRLILRPRVPGCITRYVQKEPVRFGSKRVYMTCRNAGPKIKSVSVNGQPVEVTSPDEVALLYDPLPQEARLEIATEGGWPAGSGTRPTDKVTVAPGAAQPDTLLTAVAKTGAAELPAALQKPLAVLTALDRRLANEPGADYERSFVRQTLEAINVSRQRTAVEPGPGYFRPMTPEKRAAIVKLYEDTALRMYQGLTQRMADYAKSPATREKRLAELFRRSGFEGFRDAPLRGIP
jgi:hypothetical protein